MTDVDVVPLGYDELKAARPASRLVVPLRMVNAKILETDAKDLNIDGFANLSSTMDTHFTAQAIALVRGGWLPSALACTRENAMVFLDRNVVTLLVGRFAGGRAVSQAADFLDLYEGLPVRLNPVLYAFEGNTRSVPTPPLVELQLLEATSKIQAALPNAKLMVGPHTLHGVLGLINDLRVPIANEIAFLTEIAPWLSAPVGRQRMDARWEDILAAADRNGLKRKRLIVLACLSALVVPNGKSPARRLLKFRPKYRVEDAYNAVCDLKSLEILVQAFAQFPNENTQLCTADKDLALFWTGLQVSDVSFADAGVDMTLTPRTELLPDPYAQRWASL
ncbi:MAG: hypothetical protein ACTHLA_04480 [Asticcacaulis sp.]|uniref:hypothetical protein n=1 Tax=Asticcacaulis sp. TaxID=1872648 RepID=UPI003F7B71C3